MPTVKILQAGLSQILVQWLKNIGTTCSVHLGLEVQPFYKSRLAYQGTKFQDLQKDEFGTVFQRLQMLQSDLWKTYHGSIC
eukprot:5468846-Ditylum_brightwellii.AAC.1